MERHDNIERDRLIYLCNYSWLVIHGFQEDLLQILILDLYRYVSDTQSRRWHKYAGILQLLSLYLFHLVRQQIDPFTFSPQDFGTHVRNGVGWRANSSRRPRNTTNTTAAHHWHSLPSIFSRDQLLRGLVPLEFQVVSLKWQNVTKEWKRKTAVVSGIPSADPTNTHARFYWGE